MTRKNKYIDGLRPRVSKSATRSAGQKTTTAKKRASQKKVSVAKTSATDSTVAKTSRKKVEVVAEPDVSMEEQVAAAFDSPIDPLDTGTFEIDDQELFAKDEDTDGRQNIPPKSKAKKKKKWSKKRKVLTVLLMLLLLGAGALYFWGNDLIARLTNGNSNLFDAFVTAVTDKTTPLKTDSNGRTNILVFGTSGYDMGGSDHDGAQLTDSIMVVSLDQESKDVAMLSLPRDLKVGYTCTDTGKINELYWCNNQDGKDEDGGARALMSEVGDILGIDLQYYAHMDWGALVQLVDTLGGITVTLDEDVADDWTRTYIQAGVPTKLDGEGALGLARARHGTESGDFSRGASQQKILLGIKDRVVEKELSLTELVGMLNVLGDNLRTSFSIDEVKTVAKLVQDFPMENLRQVPLLGTPSGDYMTTTSIGGISYVVPSAGVGSYKTLQKYIAKMFSTDAVAREDAVIMVLNGSEVAGMASAEKAKLEEAKMNVGIIGDAPVGEYPAYVVYDLSGGKKPATKSALESRYGVTVLGAGSLPAGIYAEGYDFVVIVGSATEE